MKNIAISLSPSILADPLSEETRSTHNMHSSHSCHTSNHQHHHQFFSCVCNQTGAINRNFGNISTHFIIIHISFIISSSLDVESCGEQSPPHLTNWPNQISAVQRTLLALNAHLYLCNSCFKVF